MPRVDFYGVQDQSREGTLRVACRVVEKAWQMGHRVFVATASAEATRQIDELLWTFRPDSFVPHGRYPEEQDPDLPILIGDSGEPEGRAEVLVNLTGSVPEFHAAFERIAEFVSGDAESRQLGRERYRYYRERDYEVKSHQIQ